MTGGVSSATATERKLMTVNPATEEILNEYDIMTKKINELVRK